MASQGLLFSEPSIAETGVWCNLADGIDPAEWAISVHYWMNAVGMEARRRWPSEPIRMFDKSDDLQGWGRNYYEQFTTKYELTIK